MSKLSRRAALATFALGAVGAATGAAFMVRRGSAMGRSPVATESHQAGPASWRAGSDATRAADDRGRQIQGYASAPSVNVGEPIDFHVSAAAGADFRISVFRLGHYGGAGARHLVTSPRLPALPQPAPDVDDATGLISCGWTPAWRLDVPRDWVSGAYLAVFTTDTGWRSCTPFVVRDDRRRAGLCVVLPFSTYQAYNQWPLDGRVGRSLYHGFDLTGVAAGADGKRSSAHRSVKVSFDRPYVGDGLPNRFDRDHDFIRWVEEAGYDVTYATSTDLHSGTVDPAAYTGVVFCGHDEYWSKSMRDAVTSAVAGGTSLAFITANNLYWHVRFEPSADGRDNRVMVCYKTDPDPAADGAGPTRRWRDLGKHSAEQGLLGVQYNGIVARPEPLVVRKAGHWFWAGCDVEDGDRISTIVAGEADGFDPNAPRPADVDHTLLSATPYRTRYGGKEIQNTSVYETPQGGIVFVAGTLDWALGLSRDGFRDQRIRTATANLVDRMLAKV